MSSRRRATALVLVDFWAEWCGPCKTLTPLLEKRTVATYAPRVSLVKIDVDKNQTLASQFRIQSIPTVYAFLNGQPVDGFQGALGERELKAFIDRLLAAVPPPPTLRPMPPPRSRRWSRRPGAALAEASHAEAAEMFGGAGPPSCPTADDLAAGYARALVGAGAGRRGRRRAGRVPPESKEPAVAQARAALALAQEAGRSTTSPAARTCRRRRPTTMRRASSWPAR